MGKKYDKLVFELPAENNEFFDMNGKPGYIMSPQAYFRGASQIPGSRYNVGFQIFVSPFFLDRIPHYHEVDEYLIFLGGTFPNLFDFDADIELSIGKPGVDAEMFYINQPTIVRIPAGVYHCPLDIKRVDKPIFFQAALMQDMFSSIYGVKNGVKNELWYNGPLSCVLDSGKSCDSCRDCIEEDWR